MGYEYLKVVEVSKLRSKIDEEFLCYIMKMMVKLGCDMFLCEIYRVMLGNVLEDVKKGSDVVW